MDPQTAQPATAYLYGGILTADSSFRQEQEEVMDAVRRAMAANPDGDCLAACRWLLHHLAEGSAMM